MAAREVLNALLSEETSAELRRDTGGLSFSTAVVDAALCVTGAFPSDLTLRTGVMKFGRFVECPLNGDHAVVGRFWHPVSPGPNADALQALGALGLSPGVISAGDYFRLASMGAGRAAVVSSLDHIDVLATGDPLPPPDGFNGALYRYQADGATSLRMLAAGGAGAFLADEMGLGKTVQAICLLLAVGLKDNLVVVPASLLENWRRELATFAPGFSVFTHTGPGRYGVSRPLRGFDVVLTTFETVVNDLPMLDEIEWNVVVVDEAQQIRNPDSRRAAAIKQLPRRISLAVTGTPVQNSLRDLWSISEFVVPQLLGHRDEFSREFPDEEAAARRLGEVVAPVTIRRLVADVATDLPELVEYPTAIGLAEPFLTDYERVSAGGNPLEVLTALRVLCAHADDALVGIAEFRSMAKVSHLLDVLGEVFERGEKALVFSSYTRSLDRLVALIAQEHGDALLGVLDGRTPVAERQPVIDRFSAISSPGCLMLNPRAAGVGLNITAANHVVHFNPEYNPQVTRQATARVYRRKQERAVFVHHLFYAETVEEEAVRIALAKTQIAEALDDGLA